MVTLGIGMVETLGVPAAIEVGDAMCKAANVTLVAYENTDLGRMTAIVRKVVSEVNVSVAAGLEAVMRVSGSEVLSITLSPVLTKT